MELSPLFELPAQLASKHEDRKERTKLERQIAESESEVEDLKDDLDHAREHLDDLRCRQADAETSWPTWDVLLMVYGAPGNWPVEVMPCDDQSS